MKNDKSKVSVSCFVVYFVKSLLWDEASIKDMELRGRTDTSERKARTTGGQRSSDHILGCRRHVMGGIFGEVKTVNQENYFDTLIQLWRAIKMTGCGKLSKMILLFHDNMRSHNPKLIQHLSRLLVEHFWTSYSLLKPSVVWFSYFSQPTSILWW